MPVADVTILCSHLDGCASDPLWDWNTIILAGLFLVNVAGLAASVYTLVSSRRRQELRDHFDVDIRDQIHKGFVDLKAHRIDLAEAVSVPASVNSQTVARIIDKEFGFTLYEILDGALDAARDYGYLVGAKTSRQYMDDIFDSHDRLVGTFGTIVMQANAGQPVDLDDLTVALSDFKRQVRTMINELRTVISTRRRLRTLHRKRRAV